MTTGSGGSQSICRVPTLLADFADLFTPSVSLRMEDGRALKLLPRQAATNNPARHGGPQDKRFPCRRGRGSPVAFPRRPKPTPRSSIRTVSGAKSKSAEDRRVGGGAASTTTPLSTFQSFRLSRFPRLFHKKKLRLVCPNQWRLLIAHRQR